MTNPAHFIMSSDFDAVANSQDYSAVLSVAGTVPVPGSFTGGEMFTTSIAGTEDYPDLQPYATSSLSASDTYLVTQDIALQRTGSTPTLPGAAPYDLVIFAYNDDQNTVKVGAYVINPYAEILTLQSETITFSLRGFIPPYAKPATIGTKATGTISIENRDWPGAGITLPKYTTFAVGDLHFVLTQSVAVPGFTGPSGSPTPGIATCPATAVETGSASNIANGTYMQIRSWYAQAPSPNDWRCYASGSFSGGS